MLEHDGGFDWARGDLAHSRAGYVLLVRRSAVNNADLARARAGRLALALHVEPALVVVFYQLSSDLPWSAARLREASHEDNEGSHVQSQRACSTLTIALSEVETGGIHPVRTVSLTKAFAEALVEARCAAPSGSSERRESRQAMSRLEAQYRCAEVAVMHCAIAMRVGPST